MITARAGIAVAEIIVYVPCAIALGFVLFRHGFHKQVGFFYLIGFIVIRLVGAGIEIASDKDPWNTSLYATAAILMAIGTSSLILAGLGLVMRIIDMTSHTRSDPFSAHNVMINNIFGRGPLSHVPGAPTATARRSRIIQLSQFPAVAGLVVCIIGGTNIAGGTTADIDKGLTMFRAGIAIFLGLYALLVVMTGISAVEDRKIPEGEHRVLYGLLFSLPLLAVRMLLACLGVYTRLRPFRYLTGSATARGLMGALPEFGVVIAYVAVGLCTEGRHRGREKGSRDFLTSLEPEAEIGGSRTVLTREEVKEVKEGFEGGFGEGRRDE